MYIHFLRKLSTSFLHSWQVEIYLFHKSPRPTFDVLLNSFVSFLWITYETRVWCHEICHECWRVLLRVYTCPQHMLYIEVSHYFGIKSVKDLICNRFEKFITSYSTSDNCLCRLIPTRCWIYCDFAIFAVFLGWMDIHQPENLYFRFITLFHC